ncbi:unnamed protein product [Triticum turgidum subsp. durum]|uniref:Uncharacterized protein n=1 Tax=Triticum turgidum subsp. durum TaxID=4567 RepID=A0A9R0RM43_TRITD|nr:unnamed protein product [Triticum turgidum subsp. durum]
MARRKPPAQHGARSEDGQAQSTAPPLKRGPWTAEEDEVLARFVAREGEGRWRTLPRRAGLLRCGKSCRLRWMNYLRPDIKRGPIAEDEEDLILRLHRVLGNRWSLIAGRLPGRTDNEIKNYWNSHLSKKLVAQGLDPRTHMPLAAAPGKTAAPTDKKTAAPTVRPPQPLPPPALVLPTSSAAGTGRDGRDNPGDGGNDDLAAAMSVDAHDFEGFGDQLLADYAASRGVFNDVMGCPMVDDDTFTSFLDSLMNERQLAADHKVGAI